MTQETLLSFPANVQVDFFFFIFIGDFKDRRKKCHGCSAAADQALAAPLMLLTGLAFISLTAQAGEMHRKCTYVSILLCFISHHLKTFLKVTEI